MLFDHIFTIFTKVDAEKSHSIILQEEALILGNLFSFLKLLEFLLI